MVLRSSKSRMSLGLDAKRVSRAKKTMRARVTGLLKCIGLLR